MDIDESGLDINSGKEDNESGICETEDHTQPTGNISFTNGRLTKDSPSIGGVDGPAPWV